MLRGDFHTNYSILHYKCVAEIEIDFNNIRRKARENEKRGETEGR